MRVSLLLCLIALGAMAVSAQVNCAQYSNCDSCTATYPCGWCSLTNNCQTGNATGSPTCTAPYWTWLESQCNVAPTPVPQPTYSCPLYDNCAQCTVLPGCGFCSLTGNCVPGTQSQSYWGNCSGSNWAWVNTQCNVVPTPAPAPPTPTYSCPMYDNCAQCTVLPGCGFCSLTGTCVPGSQTQSYWGNCSGSNWAWVNTQCNAIPTPAPTPVTPGGSCPTTFSCEKCTLLEGCEYCSTTGCMSQSGSCSGTISYNFSQCGATPVPTSPPSPTATCNNALNCQQCTALGGCGFCSYSGCQAGNQTSSFNGCSGPNWSWWNSQCPTNPPASTCSSLTSCSGCTSQLGCGWCASTAVCMVGNATGPISGTCQNWDFVVEQC